MFIYKKNFFIIFAFIVLSLNINGAAKINRSSETEIPQIIEAENEHKKELGELLLEAVSANDTKKALELIKQGADVNVVLDDEYNTSETALMKAIFLKNFILSNALIDAGADINALDDLHQSALSNAILAGPNFVKLLLDSGKLDSKIINLFNNKKKNILLQSLNPLMIAVLLDKKDIVELLLNANADINITDEFGLTPLMYAAIKGLEEIVKSLLNANADLNITDNNKKTARDYAWEKKDFNIVKILDEEYNKRINNLSKKISDSTNIPTDPARIIAEYLIEK